MEKLVTTGALARMLGPDWTRPLVWYWLGQAGIEVARLPNGWAVIPESQLSEVLFKLRVARAPPRPWPS